MYDSEDTGHDMRPRGHMPEEWFAVPEPWCESMASASSCQLSIGLVFPTARHAVKRDISSWQRRPCPSLAFTGLPLALVHGRRG
jgi:hypothetical protein